MSRARWASCTRRIVSSRWICSGGSRRASWPRSSGRARSRWTRRLASIASVASRSRPTSAPIRNGRRCSTPTPSGVNAGLAQLSAPPFEYLMLRTAPEPWKAEDSILTVLAMFVSLQGRQATFEQTNQQLRAALPDAMFRFLAEAGSTWDSPAAGDPLTRPPVPGPEVIDLRGQQASAPPDPAATLAVNHIAEPPCRTQVFSLCVEPSSEAAATIGSNNWAVDGAHSANGGALVANDMHLGLGVPNIWYRVLDDRARSRRSAAAAAAGRRHAARRCRCWWSAATARWRGASPTPAVTGATSCGSNPTRAIPTRYLTPDGPVPFELTEEAVAIKDAPARSITVRSTIWGPIVWKDHHGPRLRAALGGARSRTWCRATSAGSERVRTVDELMVAVAGIGMPNQNVAIADRSGRIAWTVGGALPRRRGFDGFTSESWADGTRGWDGYLSRGGVPEDRRSRTGPHLDGERAGRRRRDARPDRRRRLRGRHPRAHHPRSPDDDRPCHAAADAGRATRQQRAVPGSLAGAAA